MHVIYCIMIAPVLLTDMTTLHTAAAYSSSDVYTHTVTHRMHLAIVCVLGSLELPQTCYMRVVESLTLN